MVMHIGIPAKELKFERNLDAPLIIGGIQCDNDSEACFLNAPSIALRSNHDSEKIVHLMRLYGPPLQFLVLKMEVHLQFDD
jgi:hypothetical protein